MPRGRKPSPATGWTRRRIIQAAAGAFAAAGYGAASMDEVARRAGYGKGTLYFHFPGKEALFLAVLDCVADRMVESLRCAGARSGTPGAAANGCLRAHVDALAAVPDRARVWLLEAPAAGPAARARLAAAMDRLRKAAAGPLACPRPGRGGAVPGAAHGAPDGAAAAHGAPDGAAAALAGLCLSAAEGLVRDWLLTGAPPPGPPPAQVDAAAALAVGAATMAARAAAPAAAAGGGPGRGTALPIRWPTW